MGYHPRIESKEYSSFSTIRTRNSELWLIKNRKLEEAVLGYVGKYAKRYGVKLYGFTMEGNHMHSLAHYPLMNRGAFKRDLNSSVARAVARFVAGYPGGRLWARRYSSEIVPDREDVEHEFFYLVLQPVNDGLVDRISDYPGYNCFSDAINGVKRKVKVVRWTDYHAAKRWNRDARVCDFTDTLELVYERLPGYEHLSQKEYRKLMLRKLEEHRQRVLKERRKGSLGVERLNAVVPGARPKKTKTSTRYSHRPRVLCVCPKRRAVVNEWYYYTYFTYKDCSSRFRAGDLSVVFPAGTYRPPGVNCCVSNLAA